MSRAVHSNLDFQGIARAVGLLDPSSAQDAATKAYVDRSDGVSNAMLANVAAGTQKGRQIDASSPGDPVELTGDEQGENIRYAFVQVLTLAAGTYHDVEIDVRAKIVEVVPTGDVFITGFKLVLNPLAPGAGGTPGTARAEGNVGGHFRLYKHGFSSRLILQNYTGSVSANQIGNPNTIDYVLEQAATGVQMQYTTSYSKWQPLGKHVGQLMKNGVGSLSTRDITNLIEGTGIALTLGDNATLRATNLTIALATVAQRTAKGRSVSGGTGAVQDLTGIQQGENLQFDSFLQITSAPGTINDQAVNAGVKLIRVSVSSAGDLNITGFAFSAGNTGEFFRLFKQGSTGRLVLKHSTTSVAANQMILPDNRDYYLTAANDSVLVQYIGGRFQVVDRETAARLFGEIGDAATTGSVATYAITPGLTNMVTFNGVTNTIHGFTAGSPGQILVVQHIGAGTTSLVQDSTTAGAASERMRLSNYAQNAIPLVLGTTGRQTAIFAYYGNRWVWINDAIPDASVGPDQLAVVASNKGVKFCFHVPYVVGTGGAARDVALTLGEAYNFRIVEVTSMVNAAVALSSGQLRSASGGGGSALSFTVSTAMTGTTKETNRATPNNVVAGTPVYWRLTDGAVAGDIIVDCIRY